MSRRLSAASSPSLAPISPWTEGEITGLIGPNGAGKSTFFNCLAGETVPTTGRIVFDGIDVTHAAPEAHARAGIGRTFQVPITFEDMSVLHNVMVGAFLRHPHRNDARDHAQRIVELTGLARRSAGAFARHAGTKAPRNRPRAGDRTKTPAAR